MFQIEFGFFFSILERRNMAFLYIKHPALNAGNMLFAQFRKVFMEQWQSLYSFIIVIDIVFFIW